jgi:hypothetical protein
VIDLNKVRVSHRRFLAEHNAAVATELRLSAERGVQHVQERPGFKPRSGDLQRETDFRIIRRRNGSVVRLVNPKKYAGPIDKGSPPHPISARRKRALAFIGKGGGIIFRRRVNHPGNRAYHFLSSATIAAGRTFELGMAQRMRAIARSF